MHLTLPEEFAFDTASMYVPTVLVVGANRDGVLAMHWSQQIRNFTRENTNTFLLPVYENNAMLYVEYVMYVSQRLHTVELRCRVCLCRLSTPYTYDANTIIPLLLRAA